MNKRATIFESIMSISAYKVLHRLRQNQPNKVFGITDQELDDIIKYDVLSIIASYYSMMSISQKKYSVELLESEMDFGNISMDNDNLSVPMKDVVYIPCILKLVSRINVHPAVTAAYQVLFKYCTKLITSRMNHGNYAYDYLALMNAAYFSVIADGLGISDYYSRYMKESHGCSAYDDLVEHLYENNSNDMDWDLDIDLDAIDRFLEDNANANHFKEKQFEDGSQGVAAECYGIVNKVANLRSNSIVQNKISENKTVLSAIIRETGICIIDKAVISGFDCCFCRSDDYSEEYAILFRQSSYYRLIVYDNKYRESFLEELCKTVNKMDSEKEPIYIIFIKDETEPDYPDEVLRSDSASYPRYSFSKEEAISFLLDIDKRFLEKDDGYRLYIEDNRWIFHGSLYVPYIKIATVKYGQGNVSKIDLKVVFYESRKKKLWAESIDSDTASDNWKVFGLIRASTFYANQGYENKNSILSLPHIYAEIYVNDEYYGEVSIICSYEQIQKDALVLKSIDGRTNERYDRKSQNPFLPIVTAKYWTKSNDLYVPFLKIDVINQERVPANFISVEAVYYDIKNRNLWSYSCFSLVTSECTPLKQGYRKTAFLKASVGYEKQINNDSLPEITAEIYINDEFYGTINIDRTYEYSEYELPLNEETVTLSNDYVKVNNKDFCPIVKQNRWERKSDIYAPFLQIDVINQLEEYARQIDLDVYFYNLSESESWGHYTESLLPADVLLSPSFNISAFVSGPVGYENKLDAEELPDITAFVYINNDYYGTVNINNTYDHISMSEALTIDEKDEDRQGNKGVVWNKKSFLGNMGYSTRKPEDERQEILQKAVRVYGKQRIVDHISFLVNMRIAQENGAEKYKKAIRIWKDDLAYIRRI